MEKFPLIFIAIIGGLAITLQGQFMGVMDKNTGTLESVFVTYASGGLLVSIVMFFLRGGNLVSLKTVPWYVMLSGVLGLVIVGTIGYVVPRLGLGTAFTIILVSQFVLAALIDQFGWFGALVRPIEPIRILGFCVLFLGAWLVLR